MKALTIITWIALGMIGFDILKSLLMIFQEALYNKKSAWLFDKGFKQYAIRTNSSCRFIFAKDNIELDSFFVRSNSFKEIQRYIAQKELEEWCRPN